MPGGIRVRSAPPPLLSTDSLNVGARCGQAVQAPFRTRRAPLPAAASGPRVRNALPPYAQAHPVPLELTPHQVNRPDAVPPVPYRCRTRSTRPYARCGYDRAMAIIGPDGVRPGRVIFLNGTSSSGKSSIARELLGILDGDPYFHLAVDAVNAMRAKKEVAEGRLDDVLRRTRLGFHRAVAGMAAGGNDRVVDHVLSEPWRLDDLLDVLDGLDVFLVGVHCPLPELERREAARGDRPPGLAAYQYARVHAHGVYDIECDSGSATPAECAALIKTQVERAIARGEPPTAFARLRAARGPRGSGPRHGAGTLGDGPRNARAFNQCVHPAAGASRVE